MSEIGYWNHSYFQGWNYWNLVGLSLALLSAYKISEGYSSTVIDLPHLRLRNFELGCQKQNKTLRAPL